MGGGIDGPMTIATALRLPRETRALFAVIEIEFFRRGGLGEVGSWNQILGHRDKGQRACEQCLQLLASWGASDRKATRSRPVKSVKGPNSSDDGMFQAEKRWRCGAAVKGRLVLPWSAGVFGVSFPYLLDGRSVSLKSILRNESMEDGVAYYFFLWFIFLTGYSFQLGIKAYLEI